jgi:hypothetical protein
MSTFTSSYEAGASVSFTLRVVAPDSFLHDIENKSTEKEMIEMSFDFIMFGFI